MGNKAETPKERWASQAIVKMLIEMKSYKGAGEVVSGFEDSFLSYSRKIGELIAQAGEPQTNVLFDDMKRILDEAREDITHHRNWQQQVTETLPVQDDEEGLTAPLRRAFTQGDKARSALLTDVMQAHDKYLSKQAARFSKLAEAPHCQPNISIIYAVPDQSQSSTQAIDEFALDVISGVKDDNAMDETAQSICASQGLTEDDLIREVYLRLLVIARCHFSTQSRPGRLSIFYCGCSDSHHTQEIRESCSFGAVNPNEQET